jgi:hypothetical protein
LLLFSEQIEYIHIGIKVPKIKSVPEIIVELPVMTFKKVIGKKGEKDFKGPGIEFTCPVRCSLL